MQIANVIPDAESYWQSAVAPRRTGGPQSCGSREERVIRVLVNLLADDKLGDMPLAPATSGDASPR